MAVVEKSLYNFLTCFRSEPTWDSPFHEEILDTDDLTEKAYQMIRMAGGNSDYLRCDIGVRSRDYNNEEDYLSGVLAFLQKIANHPEEYLDSWNIDSIDPYHFKVAVLGLVSYVSKTIDTPIEERWLKS